MKEYEEIKALYKKAGIKRRYRTVKDGFWIFPQRTVKNSQFPCGIFVNKQDHKSNPEYTLNTYLIEVDDELRRTLESN